MSFTRYFVAAAALVVITGCAGQGDIIPDSGPHMIDIYRNPVSSQPVTSDGHAVRETLGEIGQLCESLDSSDSREDCLEQAKAQRLVSDYSRNIEPILYDDYTQTEVNRNKLLFKRIPNPDVVVYVFPHLVTENEVPIPGYMTAFPMFKKVNYALPGEINMRHPLQRAMEDTDARQSEYIFQDSSEGQ